MARRVGRHRAHLLIQAARREELHPVLTQLQHHLAEWKGARKVRWSLDSDPQERHNVSDDHPAVAERMQKRLDTIRQ